MKRLIFMTVLMSGLALLGSRTKTAESAPVVPAPSQGAYHSAFTNHNPQGFVNQAGKGLAIQMDYRSWQLGFDANHYDNIYSRGAVPHMTWEPWNPSNGKMQPDYNLQSIIDGDHDSYIKNFADDVKNWNKPIMIRWAHEMNGNWYPWSGAFNGAGNKTDYGDPDKYDGAERYRDAFRHVHDVFSQEGANNVSWIWAPNIDSVPSGHAWNGLQRYYPGNDYVDWIGLDGYNRGRSNWRTFKQIYDYQLGHFAESQYGNKPIMIAEFASAEDGGDKAQWIADAYDAIKNDYPQVKAVTWFNQSKERQWAIDSSPSALQAYQDAVSDPYFLSSVVQQPVPEPTSLALMLAGGGLLLTSRRRGRCAASHFCEERM